VTRPAAQETFRLLGDTVGIHVVLEMSGCPAERLVAAAAQRGVELSTLDTYFDGPPAMNGLILGYGAASLPKVRRAARVLRDLL
jgi:GntR family transcriptional regulator / MocR family aminotransferase